MAGPRDSPHIEGAGHPGVEGSQVIGVVGVGLIGGSVAMAARERIDGCRVVGLGRSAERLRPAIEAGVLDAATEDAAELGNADLIVVCTPVDRVAADVAAVSRHASTATVITDAGSTKRAICEAAASLPNPGRFVGSHPMAGSEKTGWQYANARLFEGRPCVVTPTDGCDADAVEVVRSFWASLGGRVVVCDPAAHDRAVARISHLPHFAAAAIVRRAQDDLGVASSGYLDTTRVAAGDADLWTAIARENAGPLADAIEALEDELRAVRTAIAAEDWDVVRSFLADAAEQRRQAGAGR